MILVVGASGTVGKEVLPRLIKAGQNVRATVRDESKAAALQAQGAESVVADMSDAASLKGALEGIDTVFVSTTATPSMADEQKALVQAAVEAGVKRFVKVSVTKCAEETCMYAQWHRPVEKAIEASGMEYTILRPNGFMQNLLANVATIQSDSAFYAPMADAKVSLVDVRDVADVAETVLTGDGYANKHYDLTGPAAVSNHEAAQAIGKAIGKDVQYVNVTPEQANETFNSWGLPPWFAESLSDLFRLYRTGDLGHVTEDVPDVLGRPARSVEQFANDHAQVFKG